MRNFTTEVPPQGRLHTLSVRRSLNKKQKRVSVRRVPLPAGHGDEAGLPGPEVRGFPRSELRAPTAMVGEGQLQWPARPP